MALSCFTSNCTNPVVTVLNTPNGATKYKPFCEFCYARFKKYSDEYMARQTEANEGEPNKLKQSIEQSKVLTVAEYEALSEPKT